jgi:hypothetical protein
VNDFDSLAARQILAGSFPCHIFCRRRRLVSLLFAPSSDSNGCLSDMILERIVAPCVCPQTTNHKQLTTVTPDRLLIEQFLKAMNLNQPAVDKSSDMIIYYASLEIESILKSKYYTILGYTMTKT